MWPILFKIGPFTIYTYGFFVFLGVIVTYWLFLREGVREGIDKGKLSNLFFWSLVSAFLGARFLYIIVEWQSFLQHPLLLLFGRSGFVFYGGLLSGLAVFVIIIKKYRMGFLKVADIAALYIPLGHALGRLGCFSYGCCYGIPTDSWLGLRFPPNTPAGMVGTKVVPTQLISFFFLLIIFFLLEFMKKRKKRDGQILASYFFLYGIFRFIIEFFRGDPRGHIFFFSTSQFISLIFIIFSLFLWRRRTNLT
jgi:phosphatidylglycerol:prolipoprotein diacylglycerol transferase